MANKIVLNVNDRTKVLTFSEAITTGSNYAVEVRNGEEVIGRSGTLIVFSPLGMPIAFSAIVDNEGEMTTNTKEVQAAFGGVEIGERVILKAMLHLNGDAGTGENVALGFVEVVSSGGSWTDTLGTPLLYAKGDTGLSAYELAVKYGYAGTEEEWVSAFDRAEEERSSIFTNNEGTQESPVTEDSRWGKFNKSETARTTAFDKSELARADAFAANEGKRNAAIQNITNYPSAWANAESAAGMVDAKLDKEYGRELVDPAKCVPDYFFNASGVPTMQKGMGYIMSDYIPVNGQDIISNAVNTKSPTIGVFNANKTPIRTLTGNQYSYVDGDAFVRFCLRTGDTISSKELRANYGTTPIADDFTSTRRTDGLEIESFVADAIDLPLVMSGSTYAIRHDTGGTVNGSGVGASHFIVDVEGVDKLYVTIAFVQSFAYYGAAFFDANGVFINGIRRDGRVKANCPILVSVPTNAKTLKCSYYTDFATYGNVFCKCKGWKSGVDGDIAIIKAGVETNRTNIADAMQELRNLDNEIELANETSNIMVDAMQFVCSNYTPNDNVYVYPVVSAARTSLTLNPEDAAKIVRDMPLVVKRNNGKYEVKYFKAAVGNVITIDDDVENPDDINLGDVVAVESVHDTRWGGNGQHLSPYGNRALGQFIADRMMDSQSMIDKNCKLEFIVAKYPQSTNYRDPNVYDNDGNVVVAPIVYNMPVGGYLPNHGLATTGRGVGVNSDNATKKNGFSQKVYGVTQGNKDAYIEFPFVMKSTYNGVLVVKASKNVNAAKMITGNTRMDIYLDGVLTYSEMLKLASKPFVYKDVIAKRITIRFTIAEQEDTSFMFNSACFYKVYSENNLPKTLDGMKIAVVGDSWTQFPPLDQAQALCPDDPDNTVDTRPNGTTLDGCGYLCKEMARYTGAVVHNWGKGGRTIDYALEKLDEILSFTDYDFLVVEFFTNDHNQGMSIDEWKDKLRQVKEKCQRRGVRPVIMTPCHTASAVQAYEHATWHEYLIDGWTR